MSRIPFFHRITPCDCTPTPLHVLSFALACTRDMSADLGMDWSSMVVAEGENVSWKSPYDWSFLQVQARERRRGRDRERRGGGGGALDGLDSGGNGGGEELTNAGEDYGGVVRAADGTTVDALGAGPHGEADSSLVAASAVSTRAAPKGKRKVGKKKSEGGREVKRRAAAMTADIAAAVEEGPKEAQAAEAVGEKADGEGQAGSQETTAAVTSVIAGDGNAMKAAAAAVTSESCPLPGVVGIAASGAGFGTPKPSQRQDVKTEGHCTDTAVLAIAPAHSIETEPSTPSNPQSCGGRSGNSVTGSSTGAKGGDVGENDGGSGAVIALAGTTSGATQDRSQVAERGHVAEVEERSPPLEKNAVTDGAAAWEAATEENEGKLSSPSLSQHNADDGGAQGVKRDGLAGRGIDGNGSCNGTAKADGDDEDAVPKEQPQTAASPTAAFSLAASEDSGDPVSAGGSPSVEVAKRPAAPMVSIKERRAVGADVRAGIADMGNEEAFNGNNRRMPTEHGGTTVNATPCPGEVDTVSTTAETRFSPPSRSGAIDTTSASTSSIRVSPDPLDDTCAGAAKSVDAQTVQMRNVDEVLLNTKAPPEAGTTKATTSLPTTTTTPADCERTERSPCSDEGERAPATRETSAVTTELPSASPAADKHRKSVHLPSLGDPMEVQGEAAAETDGEVTAPAVAAGSTKASKSEAELEIVEKTAAAQEESAGDFATEGQEKVASDSASGVEDARKDAKGMMGDATTDALAAMDTDETKHDNEGHSDGSNKRASNSGPVKSTSLAPLAPTKVTESGRAIGQENDEQEREARGPETPPKSDTAENTEIDGDATSSDDAAAAATTAATAVVIAATAAAKTESAQKSPHGHPPGSSLAKCVPEISTCACHAKSRTDETGAPCCTRPQVLDEGSEEGPTKDVVKALANAGDIEGKGSGRERQGRSGAEESKNGSNSTAVCPVATTKQEGNGETAVAKDTAATAVPAVVSHPPTVPPKAAEVQDTVCYSIDRVRSFVGRSVSSFLSVPLYLCLCACVVYAIRLHVVDVLQSNKAQCAAFPLMKSVPPSEITRTSSVWRVDETPKCHVPEMSCSLFVDPPFLW